MGNELSSNIYLIWKTTKNPFLPLDLFQNKGINIFKESILTIKWSTLSHMAYPALDK